MKKLSLGNLKAEFLKKDWLRRDSSSSTFADLAPIQGQTSPPPLLKTSACGWNSETQLSPKTADYYSRSISDLRCESHAVTERLSFPEIWRLRRNGTLSENLSCNNKEAVHDKAAKPGIFDSLKRKFKGSFKIASNERAKLKASQKQKRNSISFSIPSIAEELQPSTHACSCSAHPCHCLSQRRRGSSPEGLCLPVREASTEAALPLALAPLSSPPASPSSPSLAPEQSFDSCSAAKPPSASSSDLAWELFKLDKFGWYWGRLTRHEAEQKLADQPDGAFLVRDSSDDCHLLSLSFRCYGKTLHTRIEHTNGGFSFYAYKEAEYHGTVNELIEHLMASSLSGVFCYSRSRLPGSPSLPVRLTKPISRFSEVLPLQCLCRFVIRQYVRMDHVGALPLPERLKEYIVAGSS